MQRERRRRRWTESSYSTQYKESNIAMKRELIMLRLRSSCRHTARESRNTKQKMDIA